MRIVLLTHIYPPAIDGGSKLIAKIGEQLEKKHNQILVLTTNCWSSDDFVTHTPIPAFTYDPNIHRLPIYHLNRHFPKPIFKFTPFIKIIKKIKSFVPETIIAGPLPTTTILYGLILKVLFKTKLFIIPCFHETDKSFLKPYLLFSLHYADLICCLTKHEKTIFNKKYKIDVDKLFVISGGIDRLFMSPPSPKSITPTLLYVGSFAAHKKIELLLDAFSQLSIQYSNIKLILAGQKTLYWPIIEKKLKSMPPKTRKHVDLYLKKFTDSDLQKFLKKSTILVLPSDQESFGLVLIEAMAKGVPAIGSDISPVKELINATHGGLVFKKNNLHSLITTIEKLLTNQKLYRILSDDGYHYVEKNLTWDTIGDKLWLKLQELY